MKRYLYALGFAVMLSGIYTSCKKTTSLDTMAQDELIAIDAYVKANNLTDTKDVSGIYFKDIEKGTGDTIKSGYKVMMDYKITMLDGYVIFTNDDGYGHYYNQFAFYVDVNDATLNQQYVQQIAGLHLGMKKMQVGGKAFMIIPSELAFKAVDNSGTIGIPRFTTLLVTVYAKKGYSPEQQQ
ncbi:MAG: FKBP-type peptidyl-prolyl cis-trans isomerase [Bacteroidota bacterium]|nr:FKBP-type peptidyl-prolyl cis-trans isomerase [Bacteroidota bacterium]